MFTLGSRVLVITTMAAVTSLLVACGGSDESHGDESNGGGAGSLIDGGGTSGDGGSGGQGTGGASTTGGTSGTGGDAGTVPMGTPTPLSELGDAYETVVCEHLIECRRAEYASVEQCKADREPSGLADLETAVSEGRVSYDADAVGDCRAAIEGHLCNLPYIFFVPSVLDVVDDCLVGEGRQTAGQPCRHYIECASGTYCDLSAGTCPGTCVSYAKEGDACDPDVGPDCEPATQITLTELLSLSAEEIQQLLEQVDPVVLRCIEGTCRTRSDAGGPCSSDGDCLNGGWCDATNVCQAAITEGGSCANIDAECADGLFCDRLSGVSEGVCQPLSAAGGPCTFNGDCQGDLVCVQIDYTTYGVCRTIGTAEAPCSSDTHCAVGLGCDNNVCVALPTAGQPCLGGTDCAAGFTCVSGVCATVVDLGEPCNDMDAICAGRCLNGTCTPKAALGEVCQTDDDCASGACSNSVCIDDNLCQYQNAP